MSAEITSPWKREPDGFMSVLSSAACEWFLMFLLFIDATFSYLITKFARYCELDPPCLLCTRLDHGFGKKKPGFYWSLLCSDHREEITSLVSCSIHGKIANARSMCDECLTSITMQNNMTCSCCSETLTAKSRGYIRPPLPRTPHSSLLCNKDSLRRVRDKFIGPVTDQPAWRNSVGVDTMSSVAYTKLKLSSDSDSELAQSEDEDDGNTEEQDVQESLDKPPSDSDALESQTDQGVEAKPLPPDRSNMLDLSERKNVDPLSSDVAVGALPESSESSVSLPHMPAISVLSEILSMCSVPQLPGVTTPKNQASAGTHCDDAHLPEKNDVHHIKASIHGGETLEQSRNALEPTNTCDSAKIEDVKEVSTSDLGFLSKGTRHRAHHKHDKSRMNKDSCPRVLPVSASSETKSNGSSDEITASDNEGEDIVDQLKRQVESDQNCLSALYKDLEEERNASAIAAEEAMAMITRLQEEKAALRMEALHYLRMMEEQAAYDTQALERANDLLAEREKELQDLEYELESYRGNIPYEPEEDDTQETSVLDNQASANTETNLGASSNSES